MRLGAAVVSLLLLAACGSSASLNVPSPPVPVTTAAPAPSSNPTPAATESPSRILAFTVVPYPGQTARGSGSIAILATGYRLLFDAGGLTPNPLGGQVLNTHLGTCQNPDLSSNQLIATLRPDANGNAHLQVDYPVAYSRPPEGRAITIHGSGDAGFTHIGCGELPGA